MMMPRYQQRNQSMRIWIHLLTALNGQIKIVIECDSEADGTKIQIIVAARISTAFIDFAYKWLITTDVNTSQS